MHHRNFLRSMEHCSWSHSARDMTSMAIAAQASPAPVALSSLGADHDGHARAVDTKLDSGKRH
jgi:hypothetical protein